LLKPIEQIRIKVDRAKKHVSDFQTEECAFFRSKPYVVRAKHDPQTRQLIYYIASIRAPSPVLSAISGDAIQNLRSALDHLAYALCAASSGGLSVSAKRTYFPIFSSREGYDESERTRKVSGMGPVAIKLIDAIEPYKSGKGHALWVLHKLNITDKHKALVMVGSTHRSLDLGARVAGILGQMDSRFSGVDLHYHVGVKNKMCPLKAGHILFIDAPNAKVNNKMSFGFQIAFAEPGVAECESVSETLQGFVDLINRILPAFESLL
jgi:hypothetical protein